MTGLALGPWGKIEITFTLKQPPTQDALKTAKKKLDDLVQSAVNGPGSVKRLHWSSTSPTLEIVITGPCTASFDEIALALSDAGLVLGASKVGTIMSKTLAVSPGGANVRVLEGVGL